MMVSIQVPDDLLAKYPSVIAFAVMLEDYLKDAAPCHECGGKGWMADGETHCPLCHGVAWENPLALR